MVRVGSHLVAATELKRAAKEAKVAKDLIIAGTELA